MLREYLFLMKLWTFIWIQDYYVQWENYYPERKDSDLWNWDSIWYSFKFFYSLLNFMLNICLPVIFSFQRDQIINQSLRNQKMHNILCRRYHMLITQLVLEIDMSLFLWILLYIYNYNTRKHWTIYYSLHSRFCYRGNKTLVNSYDYVNICCT